MPQTKNGKKGENEQSKKERGDARKRHSPFGEKGKSRRCDDTLSIKKEKRGRGTSLQGRKAGGEEWSPRVQSSVWKKSGTKE